MLNLLRRVEERINKFNQRHPASEEGQAVVIVALFLFFVFLAFAALSVDGTILYLRRRQLQNIADSAALTAAIKLSQNETETEAYQAAMDSIATNGGQIEWYSTNATPNPPATNTGSGLGLSRGIEITDGCDVRVALGWSDIGTYFAQFVGRETLAVGANARAGCNRSGGLMPIALKRFGDEFDTSTNPGLNKNNASPYCDGCDTIEELATQGDGDAFDFLLQEGSDEITAWPGWPNDPTQKFVSPSPHANKSAPGREYYIIGEGVSPNVSTAGVSFVGPVNLDLRQLTSSPQTYNGVPIDANSNTLKDYVEYYIRRGYCCDIPEPGDQVAVIAGVSNAFLAQPFQETYAIGDVVATIIYDGHVYRDPDFVLSATPDITTTYPTTTTVDSNVLTYTIELEADSGFKSAFHGINMNVEGLDGLAEWAFSDDSPNLGWSGDTSTITLYVTPTLTMTTVGTTTVTNVVTGTRMFYVSAIDDTDPDGTDIRRYWAGVASIGDEVGGTQRDLPAVTAEPSTPYISVAKGSAPSTIGIDLNLWGVTSDQDVTLSAPGSLPQGFSWRNPQPDWTYSVKWNQTPGKSFNIKLEVDDTAIAQDNPYEIPLTVSSAGMESQTFNLYVLVREGDTTSKDYVMILGYAAVEVTFYDTNTVRGRIISQLWDDPSDLPYGLRPRLTPWNAP